MIVGLVILCVSLLIIMYRFVFRRVLVLREVRLKNVKYFFSGEFIN